MPHWFYNRPLDRADPTELKVAQVFEGLPGEWRIRWGYFYERKRASGIRDREGDFILLGPDGRILVVEVKSGQNRHFALTGEWEHGDDNPAVRCILWSVSRRTSRARYRRIRRSVALE